MVIQPVSSELRALADRHGIFLIEDNAQAVLGEENERRCGTVGHIGIYSLNIHKHIQCGEGGVCVTACKDLATRMAGIRNHGENVIDWLDISDLSNMIGLNLRMPEVSAAIASVQLKKLDPLVERVEKIGQTLTKGSQVYLVSLHLWFEMVVAITTLCGRAGTMRLSWAYREQRLSSICVQKEFH